ncbi:MAG: cation:proton antiporter [Ignavibacteria bacterium]
MHHTPIIEALVIIFLASLLIIFIFRKLNLPGIAGFLTAGILIGPHGFKLITEIRTINVMAEIGVMLLLFTIGLEFSVSRLLKIRRFLFVAGGMQVLFTILFSSIVFIFLGIGVNQSIFFGMLISLSSSAIVLKLLSDKDELNAPHGKISLGILIFQDLAVVPMMMMLPLLGAGGSPDISKLALNLFNSFGILVIVILVARFLIPKVLYQLAKLRIREAFTIGIILLILGTAFLTETLGLSLALGAFIAGVLLSDTEFTHQVFADILPLKDAFNSLFFVSIGLLFNYNFIALYPFQIAGLTLGIIFLKTIIIILVVLSMRYPVRVAVMAGIGLAQIGEFSFVLALTSMPHKLMQDIYYNAFLTSSIFTMLLTPLLFQFAPRLAYGTKDFKWTNKTKTEPGKKERQLKDHVIIVGFGLNGRNVARVLKETGILYIVLELNPETVRRIRLKGENIIFGDVIRKDVLVSAGIKEANIIVFAISDPHSTEIGIRMAKELNPAIHCIVRTRSIREVDSLLKLGADEVIPEEFETSLQIFTKVLQKYHIPLNIIMKQTNILRGESYEILRSDKPSVSILSHLDKILAEGLTETYFIEETNPSIGKNLEQLNIRAITGATIIAFLRNGKTITSPSGNEVLMAGDTMVIYGNHNAVDKAVILLNGE